MTLALRRQAGKSSPEILGADFSHAMLQRASQKAAATSLRWVEADALHLPFPDAPLRSGYIRVRLPQSRRLRRWTAARSNASCAPAENSESWILASPRAWWEGSTGSISNTSCPRSAHLISGVKGPYAYLPASVARFPAPDEMLQRIRAGWLQRSIVDPIHLRNRRPLPRKKGLVAPASRRLSRGRLALAALIPKLQPRPTRSFTGASALESNPQTHPRPYTGLRLHNSRPETFAADRYS